MLYFVTVNAGNYCGLGKQYTEVLFDMVRRNLKAGTEGQFIVFTDDAEDYAEGITKRPLHGGLHGWWNKLYLFKAGHFEPDAHVVFFDLDTLIVSGIDFLTEYHGDFAILRDYYRPDGWQSSVMMWRPAAVTHLWERFEKLGFPDLAGGDQQFIEQELGFEPYIIQDMWPDVCKSYKQSCINGIPKNCKIVVFHGQPKPHNAGGWVDAIWKIGGGSSIELEMVCNVSNEQLEANIRANILRDVPVIDRMLDKHNEKAMLCGGAPSLVHDIEQLRRNQAAGAKIFALNGVAKFLAAHGIGADYLVIADARPDNVDFIPDDFTGKLLLASHCDQALFDKAAGLNVSMWHRGHEGVAEIVNPNGDKHVAYIAGGSTVGMVAISLAYCLGFRDLHLFGYDSSYHAGEGHAYQQDLNKNDKILDVEAMGVPFKTSPWMLQQVNEFSELAPVMIELGCQITVYGVGLLPFVAKNMENAALPEDELEQRDGVWWPRHDYECHQSVVAHMDDCALYARLCANKRVAVQAGGNVGMWAKELAKSFEVVYTFEPDWANFQCLARNVQERNVVKMQAALGNERKLIGMKTTRTNCGAHSVDGSGIYPTLQIDDLGLDACDLIILDIEGFEYFALLGAIDTIKKFKPVIVCEEKNLGDQYGVKDSAIREFLQSLGYVGMMQQNRDIIYQPARE